MDPVKIEFLMVDKLSARLDKAVNKMEQITGKTAQANRQMQELDKSSLSLQKTVGRLASAFAMKELVSKIASVRGEFQQLEVAFKTMLGSAEEADVLMQQLTRTAATTPFGLEDVAQGAKQLLAYGLEAEKVNNTLIRLGDIAAGLSVPLNDLVYLYGTTMVQGRLYTQDLNQFTGRGIPMISELAKQFGVAESKVKELVEAGKVGFPEVQKVIESLTDEGGKFGGLMEAQSKTITGQISNIEDAISMMFNELGQQSEGVINTTLSGVSYVIEHYERFGRILLGLVGTYGVYRTAVMTVAAAKSWATAAEMLHYNWLLLVERAQKMLNATMLANPYVLVATAIAGVVAAMVSMKTEAERLQEADEAYEAQKQKVIEAEEEHRRKIEELCGIAGDEAVSTDTRREALNQLEQKYPDIFAKYDTEYEKLKNIKKIKEEIALLDGQKSITNPKNELKSVEDRIKELEAKKATERWVDANSSGTRMKKIGGLSRSEEAELKNLLGKRKNLNGQIRKNEVNTYFENLTGVSNETLAQQIRQRETLLAKMKMQEKKYGTITQGNKSLTGTYSRDELQFQLNKLRSEQNRRNKPAHSSSDWAASAKRKYQEALKAYNDFINNTANKLSQEDFEKKAKDLRDAVDVAKKEYDKVKPGVDKDAVKENKEREKARREAEKAEREAEKRKQVSEKLGQELAELQRENDAAEIEIMEEGLQKKLRQIDNDYQARKNEIDKQESDWKRDNKKAGGEEVLTKEQQNEIDQAREFSEKKREKELTEAYREEIVAMRDYLKEYGTFQQQKLAIAEEYAEKIHKAQNEGERQALEKQKAAALQRVEVEALKQEIDWKGLLGDFGGLFEEQIKPTLEKLRVYAGSDDFKEADINDQAVIYDLISQLEAKTSEGWSGMFRSLGDSVQKVKDAELQYEEAKKKSIKADEDYAEAVKRNTVKGKEGDYVKDDKGEVAAAFQRAAQASDELSNAQARLTDANNEVSSSAKTVRNNLDSLVSGLQKLGSGSMSGILGGANSIAKLFGENNLSGKMAQELSKIVGGALGDALAGPLGGEIVNGVFALLDLFEDGIENLFSSLIDTILGSINGLLKSVLSFDIPLAIGKSLVDGVSSILNTITFGGFSSWMDDSNAKEVQATINRLTERNELLQTAIEDLTDEIKSSKGTKSVAAYRDAYKYQQETNANYLQMAQAQAGYHSAHHSWNYYWGGFSQEQIDKLSSQIGRQWNGDIWNLSPEEMKALRSNVDMWTQIQDAGKGGYGGRLTEKLDDYIEQAGKLEELTNQLYEGLTGISFDGMYGSFIDNLMDMKYDAKAAAEDISEYFMRAMLSNKIGEMYSDKLKEWWEKFGKAMEDNDLTEAERKALADEYMKYVDEAIKLRDNLAAATGYDPDGAGGTSQSAKAGGFSAMTQDQGTKLEGMFTSGLQHWSSMDEKMENVSEKMNSAENHLAKIEENTGKSAEHLEKIAENMVKIIRDGLKVK